ncbi:MAG: DUF4153 domain-containing protein [Alphaproteobacteria bacterium]|nr:DUF4153 domain-containing protein [Alphaproteobacteria bacterium]
MAAGENKQTRGFALFGLVVGLATGLALYAIAQYWIDPHPQNELARTAFCGVIFFSAAFLLLAQSGAVLRAAPPAAAIAALLAGPTWFMLARSGAGHDYAPFPVFFWFFAGGPLAAFLMTTLAKASLEGGGAPAYRSVFFHGLTLPLIAAGAWLFAGLATTLLLAWAMLLKSLDVDIFDTFFHKPWFFLPFFGAIGGLSIAMISGLQSVLGALRYILLLFARIAMPITAAFSLTLIVVIAIKGPAAIFIGPTPGGLMLALAFVGMLIFNGVYQNGEAAPPPAWLRVSTIISLIAFPIYAVLAAYAFVLRVDEYGLTPPRVIGLAMNGLAAIYSVVCVAGLVTELKWRSERWMPLVAPLNTAMAALWIVALLLVASPLLNPWALSARDQELRLLSGAVTADRFDFGYLRFELGAPGARALDRLSKLQNHPEAAAIRADAARAKAAENEWSYRRPGDTPTAPDKGDSAPAENRTQPGPMDLPLNPREAEGDEAGHPPK